MRFTPLGCTLALSCGLCCVVADESASPPPSTVPPPTPAQPPGSPPPVAPPQAATEVIIENLTDQSEIEYDDTDGIWFGRYGVIVRYGTVELSANQIALSETTGDAIADGNVRLRDRGQSWASEHLEYNFKTGRMQGEGFRTGLTPFFASGLKLEGDTQASEYVATQTFITTDDVKRPLFRIKAEQFRVRPGRDIEAKNAKIYLGDTPVMVLPRYRRSLHQHDAYWRVTPGYRSRLGAYTYNSYHFIIGTNVAAGINLDLYSSRGVGVGPDLSWQHSRFGKGELRGYYIDDSRPGLDAVRQPVDPERHRLSFSHRATLRPNLTATVVAREQSDQFIIRDFYESEYRRNIQPDSFLEVHQAWSNWSLTLLGRPQLNSFQRTVERLPELKLAGLRQQIGELPLYYESESSVDYLRYQSELPGGTNYAAMRADSFQQVLWPQQYFGWLNFVPRVGGRVTQYGETDGRQSTFDEETRLVFNTGAELSTKASRVWRGAENKLLEVRELRHIIAPSINYVFVPKPNNRPHELPQFDTELPSLRLLPIEYPDYNAIDSIDSQNVLRLSLWNKLQTKREAGVQNLVHWGLYTDWRLDPRPNQTRFADVYSDLELRPRSWLTLNAETRVDPDRGRVNLAYHALTIAPNDTWSWRAGQRYFRGAPEFGPESDNNTLFHSTYVKFNENWAARLSHHFEARDGVLEEQYYTLYRDFRSWTGALTLRFRNPREQENEFAIAFSFQLKAFPRFGLGRDRDEPDSPFGG